MIQHGTTYAWSRQDKLLYAITLTLFLVGFIGTAYLLATISPYLSIVMIGLYLLGNVFQAGCCVGCPYRGQYCPALFGVYLANFLSTRLYAGRQFEPGFFKTSATLASITVLGVLVFSGYWLATLNWWYVLILLVLLAIHAALFLRLICPKCSYHETCPAGQTACQLFKR